MKLNIRCEKCNLLICFKDNKLCWPCWNKKIVKLYKLEKEEKAAGLGNTRIPAKIWFRKR